MEILLDQWTPLFEGLAEKLNSEGRKKILWEIINDVKISAIANFGEMASGPMRPWNQEMLLSKDYIRTIGGRQFATLERSEEERERCEGTRWQGGQGPHLKDNWAITIDDSAGTLTNLADYASFHQNGEGVPRRPFCPENEDGSLADFMVARIYERLDDHFQIS